MSDRGRQVKLLLRKDFLIRKRKLITLGGVVWAIVVMLSLYIVRVNINNQDYSHCSYPARALPSAGMLNFLQSFICSVNNECTTPQDYQEIPTYENSTLTKVQRQFWPLLSNGSVLELAGEAPTALRLVATLAKVADEPTFVDIASNGLLVRDLFDDPVRVQRYISKKIGLNEKSLDDIMHAQLNFQGIISNSINKCSVNSLSKTFTMTDTTALQNLVEKICPMSDKELQNILINLLPNINYNKYIKMLGKMYSKLNGDHRLTKLADTLTAVLRFTKITSFVPTEIVPIFVGLIKDYQDNGFNYYNLTIINNLMDLFEPTFGKTESYKNLRSVTDMVVTGVQWLYKLVQSRKTVHPMQEVTNLTVTGITTKNIDEEFRKISEYLQNGMRISEENTESDASVEKILSILSNFVNFVVKWLPKKVQHDFLFYSTLLSKLIEGANKVVITNVNIEQIVYKVSQRNLNGIRILTELPPNVVEKMFEALTDAARAQILTSKINFPGQVFCDKNKLSSFLVVSQEEADSLKTKFCKQEWKDYVTDLIKSFGVFDVKTNINEMASLLIQETIGRDTSEQLYTVDKDFQILKEFIDTVSQTNRKKYTILEWQELLNVTEDSELVQVIKKKAALRNQILVILHGALAHEIVKQNPILEAKISPILIDTTEILTALNKQLENTPRDLVNQFKQNYYDILHTMLLTLLNEEKTYKSLATNSAEVFCSSTEPSQYLEFPEKITIQDILNILCKTSTEIEKALSINSTIGKTIENLMIKKTNSLEDVNWHQLINSLRKLYMKLEVDYPYLFEMSTYNMNSEQRLKIQNLIDEAKVFWFGRYTVLRSMHLSLNIMLRGLDCVDRNIFQLNSTIWQQIKQSADSLNGLFVISDEMVKLITAIMKNENYNNKELPPMTVIALKKILPNIPLFVVETTDIIVNNIVNIDEIVHLLNVNPAWPCSEESISKVLKMTPKASEAVVGFETVLCMNTNLQTEWIQYDKAQKVRKILSINNLNKTENEPHLFLKLSNIFGTFIKDAEKMIDLLSDVLNDNVTGQISKGNPSFKEALEYCTREIKLNYNNATFRQFLNKIDKIFESLKTPSEFNVMSPNVLWESYIKCSKASLVDDECKVIRKATWKYTFKFISAALDVVARDMLNYFEEVSDPNATIIQVLGFNKNTGLYILYDKISDFFGVLLNSYWDLNFMNQIRKASKSMFWDCDAVVDALIIPPGSLVTLEDIYKIKPYVCPSILYWISLPRGENSFLDVIAKPQNYFYNTKVQELNSTFQHAYVNIMELSNIIANLSLKNLTDTNNKQIKIADQFENFVDGMLSWRITDEDRSYRLFNDINKKQVASTVYLTRVTIVVKKIADELDALKISDLSDNLSPNETKKLESELSAIQRLFKRRPADVLALHFDIITDLLWKQNESYQLVESLVVMCNELKSNLTHNIIDEDKRTRTQICSKNYELIYAKVQDSLSNELNKSKDALNDLVNILENGETINSSINAFTYMNHRVKMLNAMKQLVKHAEDLGLTIYVKYLQSILDHYDVILTYLSGEDWWNSLKNLYSGRYAAHFFETLEKSFEIAEDIFIHLDNIRVVRLLRDINLNNTESFCQTNITLSDYIPDATGCLSLMKEQLCTIDRTQLFEELPLLALASQGYDNKLKISKYINYTEIDKMINNIKTKLKFIHEGPKTPMNPSWIRDEKMKHLKDSALKLFSKESLTKVAFGVISNTIDASTLFLNNSQCKLCSSMTTWFKQLNLQLYKKQEYDNLLCHLNEMTSTEIYQTLKNDFHWDMAMKELISTRNYTKYELNKSINEFFEQVKVHLMEDLSSHSTKLAACLANDVTKNIFGNATLFISVISKSLQLVRVALPHIQEIEGIQAVKFFENLSKNIAPSIQVTIPLDQILKDKSVFDNQLEKINQGLAAQFKGTELDILASRSSLQKQLQLKNNDWEIICKVHNCSKVLLVVSENLNKTSSMHLLSKLQMKKFWNLDFVTDILLHIENILTHISRLLGVASDMDVYGINEGRISSLLDFLLQTLQDDTTDIIQESLLGIMKELDPLLKDTPLQYDLKAISNGLKMLVEFKNSSITNGDFKVNIQQFFVSEEKIEFQLSSIGINNTNFWSIAAPRVRAGHIDIKPLLTNKSNKVHIRDFVCDTEKMSRVILPANVDVVTLDDIYGAIVEQFCDVDDIQAKEIVPILIENLNFTFILDKVANLVKMELFLASNITKEEGESVFSKYRDIMALVPELQENIGSLSDTLANEPVFAALKDFSSLNNLLSSSGFLASAGNMMCGKPFVGSDNRFYKAIAETEDFSTEPDPSQIEVLPTDFCRSLYRDILSMSGGKIVWSFIKPLIMGKILYTPNIPTVDKIIEKANASFALMSKLVDIVHSFAGSFDAVETLIQHKDGIDVLRNLMNSVNFRELMKTMIGQEGSMDVSDDVKIPNININDVFNSLGDVKDIGHLLRRASDLLYCVNMNRFHAMPTEEKLTNEAVKLTRVNEFSAGLVFTDIKDHDVNPINVVYKIRMDIDSVPTTTRKRNQFWTPGPEASFLEDMRYFRGFVQIQDMIDKAIIELSTNTSNKVVKRDVTSAENRKWAIYTQQMPYPCYRRDYFQSSLYESQALIVALFFSLILSVSSAIRFIVSEKESGITMLMSVMGVSFKNQALSWFTATFAETVVTITGMFAVLKLGGILPHSDPFLLWLIMMNFGLSVVMFCYLLSKFFKSSSLGAVCAVLIYLVTFMPYVIILSLEAALTEAEKVITSLSMSTAFCYSMLYVARFEAIGVGAHWANVWHSPVDDGMSIASTSIIVLFDSILYLIIACLIDKFFGPKTLKSNINKCTTSSEKAGVSIINITKIYGAKSRKPKIALDNVSIELHKGQITTLLGHNGAGKTTLIKIITGMLKPTKGHVIVRGESGDSGTTQLGVCPQNDVLFENLTTVEHLIMYAQLKSELPLDEIKSDIENMLQVLSFGPLAHEQVHRLSGGLRRRLCVALAFIARPQLVLLDEPSSGVDPLARRDIWSLIVKLKEDRTVLLTTHHLDEAELLSDHIVIMHKGQIHTVGSPVEIKRSLGNGYKLAVTYPAKIPNDMQSPGKYEMLNDDLDQNVSMEERTKQLAGVVVNSVTNAQVEDVNGTEVEMLIPFFDANGLNNDLLRLCTDLESKQNELGFTSYSLDCSSLEQVFFNICQQVDEKNINRTEIQVDEIYDTMSSRSSKGTPSKSTSTTSFRNDKAPLVPDEGRIKGTNWEQFLALINKRWIHYTRNVWLLFLLVVLPTLFVTIAMAFSLIRPPADNEVSLQLTPDLYEGSTEFLIPTPTTYGGEIDPKFAENVMSVLSDSKPHTYWSSKDMPTCQCTELRQECNHTSYNRSLPEMFILPDVNSLNDWLIKTQEIYIEKRYGGWSSSLENNITNFIAWYNNKGHHAMPSYVNTLNSAILKVVTGEDTANITTYTHPLKISHEQLSKSTVLQHVADAGISGMLLIAVSLVTAGAAVYLVLERTSQQKRLQLLSGVTPATYWMATLTWDMAVILVNICLTSAVLLAFDLPVFISRQNLPAICLLLLLFGFSCTSLVHVLEKSFTEASMANMILFCGNVFLGLSGLAILLILDIISESEATDNARWVLHKLFLMSPQFALGDALLEIAKNTVQAQVLSRFGMDTYRNPFETDLIVYHCIALLLVGLFMLSLNLAIEYDLFDNWICRWRNVPIHNMEMEDMEVAAEKCRVEAAAREYERPITLQTLGNINAGFVDTESKKGSMKQIVSPRTDVAQCVGLGRTYRGLTPRVALKSLYLGIPPGQCTALLGQNGAGKSTTFSLLCGELRPTCGRVVLNGKAVTQRQLCSGLISYCPQGDALDPLLTVRQTLQFYCKLRGLTDTNEVIKRTLGMFDLHKYSEQQCATLSGGNKRKLSTAIAFMGRAPLVLLDEPTSGMDPGSRWCVCVGVRAACAARRGVLLSTHALDDARVLARRVALLRDGVLCALAPLDQCLTRFGSGHVVSARVERGGAGRLWPEVAARAPHAQLQAVHHNTLQFLVPARAIVDGKEVVYRLSDVFKLLAELQGTCELDDYTLNTSSLEQMFLNFSGKDNHAVIIESTQARKRKLSDQLQSVTAL